ncbi:MAG: envelope stress response membrane protein PspC [Idiomarina sp.]|nr:envelope stress response membrane protein PspC [Idiomarina sp.]
MHERQKELFRDPVKGKLGGVCAGLAERFGWELWVVRIIAITCLVFAAKFAIVAYIAAWIFIDKKPAQSLTHSKSAVREETRIERTRDGRTIEVKTRVWEAGKPPKQALKDLVDEFNCMESSLRSMERYVTSSEFRVKQEISRL